jgi:tetratricopeptide (TPR) repeat protein
LPPPPPRGPPPPPPLAAVRPPPPPPLPDDDDDEEDLTAPPSQESERSEHDDGTHDLPVSNGSSAEILDSALVIRPAAKAMAPAMAKPLKPMADLPVSNGEDDDFMVDPDATMNLPPLLKSQEGKARRASPPDPPVDVSMISTAGEAAIPEPGAQGSLPPARRPPTEDMRRKARNLFEQAQKDHAIGRIGAARMNAKLATIYDPDNEEFRRVLEQWEERPKPGGGSGASSSRPEYVVLYEQAQDLEDEGDVDGALELLQKGIRMAPNAAAFHNRIGVILAMRKREFDRAAAEIEKAISLEPDNPHYRNNLGKVMQKGSKRKDAAVNAR